MSRLEGPAPALLGGLAGATALTLIHEGVRRIWPGAPRIDTAGRRSIALGLRSVGVDPPEGPTLQAIALAGDIVTNTLFYATIGLGGDDEAVGRGGVIGAVGGLGTLAIPPLTGLGHREIEGTPARAAATLAYYLAGGLVAGVVYSALARRR